LQAGDYEELATKSVAPNQNVDIALPPKAQKTAVE
jgi:hypothetical protein